MSNEITNIKTDIQPMESIESRILTIRGRQVMLDRDLAELYGVETKALNQAVKRNAKRFPEDFMFQLSKEESTDVQANLMSQNVMSSLRSQNVTLNNVGASMKDLGKRLFAFTKMAMNKDIIISQL